MSFFDVSLEAANRFYTWGWRGSIIGAVVTAIAVCFLMWGTRIRDHDAELQMSLANSTAAKANERAATLEAQAAALSKEAADAKLEQERIKAQLTWRTLNQAMIDALVARLRTQPGFVVFAHNSNDSEALFLVIQLSQAFSAAGWQTHSEARSYADRIVLGIVLPPVSADLHGAAVREAFQQAGIPFTVADLPGAPMTINKLTRATSPMITVFIGSKPPPF